MTTENAERHAEYSQSLIKQANYELAEKGDRVQASDKAAGAVAHAVKAIAEDRQWRHGSHNLRREVIDLLVAEFDRPELRYLQDAADRLHDNFYEDLMRDWQIKERIDMIAALLESLMEIRSLGRNPDFLPSPEQQRSIERLSLSAEEARANASIDFPPPLPPLDLPGYSTPPQP